MCSRAFYDAAGAPGPFNGVSSVPSAGAAARYRRGTSRRDSTLRVAEHFTYEHGKERYVVIKSRVWYQDVQKSPSVIVETLNIIVFRAQPRIRELHEREMYLTFVLTS